MKCLDEAGKVSSRLFIPPQLICAAAPMFTLTLLLAAAILIYIDTDPCLFSVYSVYRDLLYVIFSTYQQTLTCFPCQSYCDTHSLHFCLYVLYEMLMITPIAIVLMVLNTYPCI